MTARAHRLVGGAPERGSAAVEVSALATVLLLVVGVLVVGGRFATAGEAITGVAGSAAREASLARDPGTAAAVAASTVRATLAAQNVHCQGPPTVRVDTSGFNAAPGVAAVVVVDVSCVVDVNGFAVPGLPGTRVVHDEATSPIDPYRSLR